MPVHYAVRDMRGRPTTCVRDLVSKVRMAFVEAPTTDANVLVRLRAWTAHHVRKAVGKLLSWTPLPRELISD